jgi:hypothetical protein
MELTEYFALMRTSNAGVMKIVARDEHGRAKGAVIFIDGADEAEEIIAKITAIEDAWEIEP